MTPPEAAPSSEPPFDAPWQAQAFALTVALHRAGLFTWSDWTHTLSDALSAAASDGADYYDCWVRALERMIERHALASPDQIEALAASWARAAQATPHGHEIRLANDPQATAPTAD